MSNPSVKEVAEAVIKIDVHLREELIDNKQLWEKTYIEHQVYRRNNGEHCFSLQDHIRAMVYSMVSAGISWKLVEKEIDPDSGKIICLDKLFENYEDAEAIVKIAETKPSIYIDKIKEFGFISQYTERQMKALSPNIRKFQKWNEKDGSIDYHYCKIMSENNSINHLIKKLSTTGGEDKLIQLGIPLTAEYLKNVGYSVAKPDRHIRRILGKDCLGCFNTKYAPEYKAIDFISEVEKELGNKTAAEIDYILWMYCATGFGEICIKRNDKMKRLPKCGVCKANSICSSYSKSFEMEHTT